MIVSRGKPPFFRHSHNEAIGAIKKNRPWIEDTWSVGSLVLIHWQNVITPSTASCHHPRHVWRLGWPGTSVELQAKYGLAPYIRKPS